MASLPFPEIDTISAPSTIAEPTLISQSVPETPAIVPNLGVAPIQPVAVPNALTPINSQYQPVPEWTYKKFHITDIFYSKIGISSITSLLTFSILATINPPFVQETSENPIEINKPSFPILYCISLVIFVMMMVVPVSGKL